MKRRILSRVQIAELVMQRRNREQYDGENMRNVETDIIFHLIADGSTVKVYVDKDMGGTVVEF